jgi:hypothetical protein
MKAPDFIRYFFAVKNPQVGVSVRADHAPITRRSRMMVQIFNSTRCVQWIFMHKQTRMQYHWVHERQIAGAKRVSNATGRKRKRPFIRAKCRNSPQLNSRQNMGFIFGIWFAPFRIAVNVYRS